jgi:hypothetical protein
VPLDAPTTSADRGGRDDTDDRDDRDDDSGDAGTGDPTGRGWGIGRIVVTLVVVGLVAMWGYVVYLAFGPGREPPVDRLDDPSFARAAEERCADAVDRVSELPLATESSTARARAGVLDQANATFAAMLDDLDGMTRLAPAGDQRERARLWLDDWRVYLGDRVDYADALRTDPGARLTVSEKGETGRHITGWIDEFALANRMPSCATPTDA